MKKNKTVAEVQQATPLYTPEAREKRCIDLAMNLVEQRLLDGTATAQEVCYFLKLGSPQEKLNQEIKESQRDLMNAKTHSIHQMDQIEKLYSEAVGALHLYSSSFKNEELAND